ERNPLQVSRGEVLLELADRLHLAHELECLGVAERLVAVELVAVLAQEVLELTNVPQLLEEILEVAFGGGILEAVVLREAGERVAEALGEVVKQRPLLTQA